MSSLAPRDGLAGFLPARTGSGRLELEWEAATVPADSRAVAIVALRELCAEDAAALWRGELDNDLIRVPLDAAAGRATVWVPADRPLTVGLVVRDRQGRRLPSPALAVAAPAVEPDAAGPVPESLLTAPVAHTHGPAKDIPLIFAEPGAAPDLEALARRVAAQVGAPAGDEPFERRGPGCFGTRQRWYLTRLRWEPAEPEQPALLVVRSEFISDAQLRSWQEQPPPDAFELPPDVDGAVDALTPPEAVGFYALLRGPRPWMPQVIDPLPPPFAQARRPVALGPVAERLHEGARRRIEALDESALALAELPPLLSLLEASVATLDAASPARLYVEAQLARLRAEPRF